MGTYQITNVRVSDKNATSTEKITDVRLENGKYADCTVAQIVKYLEGNNNFFYTTANQPNKSFVEVVYPSGRDPYIRTKANSTTKDNLLNLKPF